MIKLISFNINNRDNKKIIIYGATIWGRLVYDVLKRNQREIAHIYDAHRYGEKIGDMVVENVVKVTKEDDSIFLLCATKGLRSMCDFLEKKGIECACTIESILAQVDFEKVDLWDAYSKEEMIGKYMLFVNEYLQIESDGLKMSQLGIMLTDFCTLKCKYCIQQTPYLRNKKIFNVDEQIIQLKKILSVVTEIYKVSIVGGEAFINQELYKMVNFCVGEPKIKRIEILSNATIVPKEENLRCLKHDKVRLVLDDYGDLSWKLAEIESLCKKEGINYSIMKVDYWYDLTEVTDQKYSDYELEKMYRTCEWSQCYTLYDTRLINCPYSYCNMLLQKIEGNAEDSFLELVKYGMKDKKLKEDLRGMMSQKYINACRFCLGTGEHGKMIPVAEQI